jgi:enoyl-CoA hydratase
MTGEATTPVAGLRVTCDGPIAQIMLDRPETRNALSTDVLQALATTMATLDADPDMRCIVVSGLAKVFASGADLRDLQSSDAAEHYRGPRIAAWQTIRAVRTPSIAKVSGFCLGGGLELALSCGIVIAADTARFGFPETMLGLIPAAGGTQRLPVAVGRAKALDMILTGRLLDADEAERAGLVSRVTSPKDLSGEVDAAARAIASRGPMAQLLARETVEAAFEAPLGAGLLMERRAFAMALASDEAREGIAAFVEKRDPSWKDPAP